MIFQRKPDFGCSLKILVQVVKEVYEGDISVDQIRTTLYACNDAFGDGEFDPRMAAVAARLTDNESREAALQVAAAVILSNDDYEIDNEGQFFVDLADALGVTRRTAGWIWKDVFETY